MASVQTISCGCNNGGDAARYQDQHYGRGNRVFTVKKNGTRVCTICSKEDKSSAAVATASKKKK